MSNIIHHITQALYSLEVKAFYSGPNGDEAVFVDFGPLKFQFLRYTTDWCLPEISKDIHIITKDKSKINKKSVLASLHQ